MKFDKEVTFKIDEKNRAVVCEMRVYSIGATIEESICGFNMKSLLSNYMGRTVHDDLCYPTVDIRVPYSFGYIRKVARAADGDDWNPEFLKMIARKKVNRTFNKRIKKFALHLTSWFAAMTTDTLNIAKECADKEAKLNEELIGPELYEKERAK